MDVFLLIASAGAICITLGGIGLHYETKKRFDELEEAIKAYDNELVQHKRDIRVLKEREAQKSDRVYIVTGGADDGRTS